MVSQWDISSWWFLTFFNGSNCIFWVWNPPLDYIAFKVFFRRLDKIIDCWNVSTSKWDISWNGGRKMMVLSHANWTQLQPHHRRWLLSGKIRRIPGCPFGKSSTTRDIFHLHVHQSLDVFLILYIHEYPRIPCFPWFPIPHFHHIFMAIAEQSKPRNERLAGLLARGGASAGNFPGGVRSRQVTRHQNDVEIGRIWRATPKKDRTVKILFGFFGLW